MPSPSPREGGPLADGAVEEILAAVDPRLRAELSRQLRDPRAEAPPPAGRQLVLVGHRAAGKTRLLPLIAAITGRAPLDLDRELERLHGRALRDWVRDDAAGFRAAERAGFASLPADAVVAVGGGFLSLHGDLLADRYPVLVPVTFETYRERLLADATRPRLRPELSVEEELRQVFTEREAAHARVRTVALVDLLRAVAR